MSIWAILRNLGFLVQMFKTIQGVVTSIVTSETKIPSVDQIRIVLDCIRSLLDRQIIDIPGVDEAKLSEDILKIEGKLTGIATEALKNFNKYGDFKPRIEAPRDVTPTPDKIEVQS